jgi:putative endonuclease
MDMRSLGFVAINILWGVATGLMAWLGRSLPTRLPRDLSRRQKKSDSHRLGQLAEQLAARFLLRRGYSLLGCRVDYGLGEMDLVMVDHVCRPSQIVVVEVKALRRIDYRRPEASVGAVKLRRLQSAGIDYIKRHHLQQVDLRIDVIAVHWPERAWRPDVRHIKGCNQELARISKKIHPPI